MPSPHSHSTRDRSLNYGRGVISAWLTGEARRAAEPPRAASPAAAAQPPVPHTPVVVDLGAGHGDDLVLAREAMPGAHLHAVERMDFHAAILRGMGFAVHSLDLERDALPFADASVDVVIANQVLEHCKEIWWIAHEVCRVLKVGGAFVAGVPNLGSLHNRVLLALGRQPTSVRPLSAHVRGFTLGALGDFVAGASRGVLRVEARAGANFYPLPRAPARLAARLLPGLAVSAFVRARKVRPYAAECLDSVRAGLFETQFVGDLPR